MFTAVIGAGRRVQAGGAAGGGHGPGGGRCLGERACLALSSLGPPSSTCVFETPEQVYKMGRKGVGGVPTDQDLGARAAPRGALPAGPGPVVPSAQGLQPRGPGLDTFPNCQGYRFRGSGPRGAGGLRGRARVQGAAPLGLAARYAGRQALGAPRPAGAGGAAPRARARRGRLAGPGGRSSPPRREHRGTREGQRTLRGAGAQD